MFDFFLYERYSIPINETNLYKIQSALNATKEADGWENDIKSPNERKKDKAITKQKQWNADCNILLNENARTEYLARLTEEIEQLVDYITEEEQTEEAFKTYAENACISVDDVKKIYMAYNSCESNNISPEDAEVVKEYATKYRNLKNSYSEVFSLLTDDNIKLLREKNVDLSSVFSIIDFPLCNQLSDCFDNMKSACEIVYSLYNSQLLSPEVQKKFLEFFSTENKAKNAVLDILDEEFFNTFSKNDFVLLKYIDVVCLHMNSQKTVSSKMLNKIDENDVQSFVEAMESLFGVVFNVEDYKSNQQSKNIPQKELELGNKALLKGDYDIARQHFENQIKIDSYNWKPYWGIFKCLIKVRDDNKVVFPEFHHEFVKLNTGLPCEDYVRYFKFAKERAYAEKDSTINFDLLESEYQKAAEYNKSYKESMQNVSDAYNSKTPEKLPFSDSKVILNAFCVETLNNKLLNESKPKLRIFSKILSLIMFVLAVITLLFNFNDQDFDNAFVIAAVYCFAFFSGGVLAYNCFGSFLISLVADIANIALIGNVGSNNPNVLNVVFTVEMIALLIVPIFSLIRRKKYLTKIESSDNKLAKLKKQVIDQSKIDIERLNSDSLIDKYHITKLTFKIDLDNTDI